MTTLFEEVWDEAARTGAPYPELLCLRRSLTRGRSIRVDVERRACVVTAGGGGGVEPGQEFVYPWGWLDSSATPRALEVA